MKYKIVGYGSIMSHKSLRETVPDKRFEPVIVKGYKRIFDIVQHKSDVLNLEKSKGHSFNGVMFTVNAEQLKELKKRESGYNLEKVWAYAFPSNKRLYQCSLFVDHCVAIDKQHLKPQNGYFKLCREAAYHISKDFGKMWDDTTYVSNGRTVASWIKKNKTYNSK